MVGANGLDRNDGKPIRYSLSAKIVPDSASIAIRCSVSLELKNRRQEKLAFSLYNNFAIDSLTVNGQAVLFVDSLFTPSRDHPAEKKVILELPVGLRRKNIDLMVAYHGTMLRLPEFNSPEAENLGYCLDERIDTDLVELTKNARWYPYFGEDEFNIDLRIELPARFICICSGTEIERSQRNGRLLIHNRSSSESDINIVASPHFKKIMSLAAADTIFFYYTVLPDTFIEQEASGISQSLMLFRDLLGPPAWNEPRKNEIYAPRGGSGGYARPTMAVTSESRYLEVLAKYPPNVFLFLRGSAHELAHGWWNFGTGQGSWIDETFAEYFALVAVERLDSPSMRDRWLRSYAENVAQLPGDAPSLSRVPNSNADNGEVIRHHKGALMLHAFRGNMGDSIFFKACHDFYENYKSKQIGTQDFVSFWVRRLGENRELLHRWINSSGGLPTAASDNHK